MHPYPPYIDHSCHTHLYCIHVTNHSCQDRDDRISLFLFIPLHGLKWASRNTSVTQVGSLLIHVECGGRFLTVHYIDLHFLRCLTSWYKFSCSVWRSKARDLKLCTYTFGYVYSRYARARFSTICPWPSKKLGK